MQKATNQYKLLKLLAASVGLSALQATTSFAVPTPPNTTITFSDGTDSLGVGATGDAGGPGTSDASCIGETCTINLFYPTGGATSGVNIGLPLFILEPGSSVISDTLSILFNGNLGGFGVAGYVVTFTSDTDETLGLGTYTTGDAITETGAIQTAFTLTFNDVSGFPDGTATIKFQSDLDSTTIGVPEPISLALFGGGLIGLGALRRRSRARA